MERGATSDSIATTGRDSLSVVICASAGDEKSALTGRLLQEGRPVPEGQRGVIAVDVPGHPRFSGKLAMAATDADLAVLVVDARQGVRTETRRHATIAGMAGIRFFAVAVDNMDRVDWDEARFREVETDVSALMTDLDIPDIKVIPVSASQGDNIFASRPETDWYQGPALMAHLESVRVDGNQQGPLRLPVQQIMQSTSELPGVDGVIRGGVVRAGDALSIWPAGNNARVTRIRMDGRDVDEAATGDAVTVVLDRTIDVAPGDMITHQEDATVTIADQFQAKLVWFGDKTLVPERTHLIRFDTSTTTGRIMKIKHRVDVETLARLPAGTLECNDIAVVTVLLDRALLIDEFLKNRKTGRFVVIDCDTDSTIAAGMVDFPLRRATNVIWHQPGVDKALRASNKNQRPRCLWFTGLSGSGKSTLANTFDRRLTAADRHTYVLDGDNIRHGLNHDLGFTEPDRVENIRRMAEVAKLMVDAGLIVLVCAISPYRRDREMARGLFEPGEFVEVFVDTPIEECEARDPKGLYRKARAGEIPNFTGISAPYERPEAAEVHLDGTKPVDHLVDFILSRVEG